MPRFEFVTENKYNPSFRAAKIMGMFEISPMEKLSKKWDCNLPIEEKEWNIGLIVGPSGSGKSTLANQICPNSVYKNFEWGDNCLLDYFPENSDIETITRILSQVGFSSPPSWLLPYSALSTGQKFRVELARCLLEYKELFVFDEFTSVVDREAAKISSFAFQKAIKKENKKMIAVTCHYDVEEFLQPDWVFDMKSNEFKWGCLRRPEIKIEIQRVNYTAWELFKEHHYLSHYLSKSSICYIAFLKDEPICFSSWICNLGVVKGYREHRTVVLPEYQGLGVGKLVSDIIASKFSTMGYRVYTSTSHPAMVRARLNSKNWIMTSKGRSHKDPKQKVATNRLTAKFKYIGVKMDKSEALKFHG